MPLFLANILSVCVFFLFFSFFVFCFSFFFQAEDGIRDLVRSRGLGDVYKRQGLHKSMAEIRGLSAVPTSDAAAAFAMRWRPWRAVACLLSTSDAADERSSVDLGGRRILTKKQH